MLLAIEQQHVAGTQQRPQRPVGRARVDILGPEGVQLLHAPGIAEDHPDLAHHPHCEHVAERPLGGGKEPIRVQAVAQCLQRQRLTRAARKRHRPPTAAGGGRLTAVGAIARIWRSASVDESVSHVGSWYSCPCPGGNTTPVICARRPDRGPVTWQLAPSRCALATGYHPGLCRLAFPGPATKGI